MSNQVHIESIEDLFTDKLANEGIRFPIRTAAGQDTDGWLLLRNIDSEAFEAAAIADQRRQKEIEQLGTDDEKRKAKREAGLRLTASMVAGWSFSKPCTTEAVVELLRRAKYLADDIDQIAFTRQRFYAGASSSLPGTPKRPTDSTDQPAKDPTLPSGST